MGRRVRLVGRRLRLKRGEQGGWLEGRRAKGGAREFKGRIIIYSCLPKFIKARGGDVKNLVHSARVWKINIMGVFVGCCDAEVNAAASFGGEFCRSLVRFKGDIHRATPDTKVRNIRFLFREEFIGCEGG